MSNTLNDKKPSTHPAMPAHDKHGAGLADPSRREAVRQSISYVLVSAGIAAVAALSPRRAHAYYGKCYLCNCCSFMGSDNTCSNCGHSYSNHSGQTCNQGNS